MFCRNTSDEQPWLRIVEVPLYARLLAEIEGRVTSILTHEPLTAVDRCDRCGAQAYVRVIMAGGSELLFCAHHGREYAPALTALEATIRDESERLDESQPTPAASAGLPD